MGRFDKHIARSSVGICLPRASAARESGGGDNYTEDGDDADGRKCGVETVETGSAREHGQYRGDPSGGADLAHGLDQPGRQPCIRL